MKHERLLTQECFDRLLMWLDADRSKAGEKYEQIRRRLIKVFIRRGCPIAEELADETIDRVSRKAAEIGESYVGDPVAYFCGVAQKVFLEYVKPKPVGLPVPALDPPEIRELDYKCLERCMEQLDVESREWITEYYSYEKRAKIRQRKLLASKLGVTVSTLRMRAHRIKANLKGCVAGCVAEETDPRVMV